MAVVRCPKHNIPYNDENPRGCPACAAEREGLDPKTAAIKELARASRGLPRTPEIEILPPPEDEDEPPRATGAWPPPVTQPPRRPAPQPTRLDRALAWARLRWGRVATATVVVFALVLMYEIARPSFTSDTIPPVPVGDARPVPVTPNIPLDGVFAVLGTVAPTVNPDTSALARFMYPDSVTVDVLNTTVYAVTLASGQRAWRGLRVGMDSTAAAGALALLGAVHAGIFRTASRPTAMSGYLTYPSLADRPRRLLISEVRPPNGCYDVQVELAPRVIGWVERGDHRFAAVARRDEPTTWVVDRIRSVSRLLPGPYAGPPACTS